MSVPAGVRVRVPAKINLGLAVGPCGDDGYHPLTTVFQSVGLHDDIVASWAPAGEISLTMAGEGAEALPVDGTNLAIRAAALLRDRFGGPDAEELGVHLSIRKGIPIAGGMAGGSADAAGTLLACSVLWDLDTSPDDLRELGAELGADVPFCLMGGTAIGTGRGDRLTPALSRGTYHWVLGLADEGLSTPAVYGRFDEMADAGELIPDADLSDELLQALMAGDAAALGRLLRNDLQAPAVSLRPVLGDVLETGLAHGALGALVSGSGPTVALLAADESSAMDLAGALTASGLCRAVKRVTGPVPGARVVSWEG